MEAHLMRDSVLKELHGRLWHTTHPNRFKMILETGVILPSKEAGNPDRWKSLGGEDCCPYVEKLGGVSLFDFAGFDPETYSREYRLCSWDTFVPYREDWGSSVWIEIDRGRVKANLISASEVVTRWKSEKAYRHNFMPEIEAIHVGPLPCAAFLRAFIVGKNEREIRALPL